MILKKITPEIFDILDWFDTVYILENQINNPNETPKKSQIQPFFEVKNNLDLKECMALSASRLLSKDEQFGLCILYSYDFMYLAHDCISDYLKSNLIAEDKIKKLKECLNN